jgi:hypothetical protein
MWDRNSIKMNKLTQINSSDAKYLVYAKATYYPDFVRVFIPNQPYIRQVEGYEQELKLTGISNHNGAEPYETNEERSIRRTRKAIKDYALCNDFNLFATFTMADNRYDDERSKKRIATWFKNQRNRNGKFQYIIVAERHKDGALHFHALIGGYTGRLVYAVSPKTGKHISDKHGDFIRNFDEYTLGINSAKIISTSESKTKTKTAYYLQKYINKDMIIVFGKNRYWASKGLLKPPTEENPEEFYKAVEADRHWMIDHGTILEFDRNKHPIIDMFLEAHKL